jgi:hypothetical protein
VCCVGASMVLMGGLRDCQTLPCVVVVCRALSSVSSSVSSVSSSSSLIGPHDLSRESCTCRVWEE